MVVAGCLCCGFGLGFGTVTPLLNTTNCETFKKSTAEPTI